MKYKFLLGITASLGISISTQAQKKPLDHTVYDSWQSITNSKLSNNGAFIAYNVAVQEGDGILYVQKINGDTIMAMPRGAEGYFTSDNQYFVCKIKPSYQQTRQAKIDKKTEADLPKDSLAILTLANKNLRILPRVKSFEIAAKEGNILAWLSEKELPTKNKLDSAGQLASLQKEADSLHHLADSLKLKILQAQKEGLATLKKKDAKTPKKKDNAALTLHIWNWVTGDTTSIANVSKYEISDKGNQLVYVQNISDTSEKSRLALYGKSQTKILLDSAFAIQNLSFDKEGQQIAFVADTDSSKKALRNYYNLYLFAGKNLKKIADKNTLGVPTNFQISEFGKLKFSASGKRLFFGTAPILPLKDTSLPEFERVQLDIWNYREDELHTVQLFNLSKDLKKSYTAVYDIDSQHILQLQDSIFTKIYPTADGDGRYFYVSTDSGRRVASQWLGYSPEDIYTIDMTNGRRNKLISNFIGEIEPSYLGNRALLYFSEKRKYQIYQVANNSFTDVKGFTEPIFDVENDVPSFPPNYGVAGWTKNDGAVYVNGQFDIWKVGAASGLAKLAIPSGKSEQIETRYISLDKELNYIKEDSLLAFNQYYKKTKNNTVALFDLTAPTKTRLLNALGEYKYTLLDKAEKADIFALTKQNFTTSPNLLVSDKNGLTQMSDINPQQAKYSWGNAQLYKWKAYTGKETEGILYTPEGFDSTKKYPLIAYFYERNNETLYGYQAPSPTPSRLNIPFFVSRGYVVFVPDIWYKTGHPGQAAYDYIVSGVRSLVKKGFIDSTKMGIQGQSWGGYQTAFLITKVPNMFAAAWAGAPVVNMFSAYGGIRWTSGLNRQFQYEKTQSRIGATPWEKPELYVENSPFFNLPKVKTPLVIMANDADGAVPWYQGIEMFTDMRRLGKQVWMLNYNGEAHNLMERRNRKDIQIREQQFFDWLLKGDKAPVWITTGVPAVLKDKTMGLEY